MNICDSVQARRESGRVLAIVVTYIPERTVLRGLLQALHAQTAAILVVDNSPPSDDRCWDYVADLSESDGKIRLIRLGGNFGIGAALNVGIEVAQSEDFDHVLLSDQDSLPVPDMVPCLVNIYRQLRSNGIHVGCVAPEYFDQTTEKAFPFQVARAGHLFYGSAGGPAAMPWLEILTTISSGSLLPLESVRVIGMMREDLFIDHVDTEWCHRARSLGYRLFGTSGTRLNHRLGDGVLRIWYFGWRNYSEYSPSRLYYRFRNFVLLCKMRHVTAAWKLRAAWYWAGNAYVHLIFSRSRSKNFVMIVKGLWDGLLGRVGPLT